MRLATGMTQKLDHRKTHSGRVSVWAAFVRLATLAGTLMSGGLGPVVLAGVLLPVTGCKRVVAPAPAAVHGRIKSANGRPLPDVKLRLVAPDKIGPALAETVSTSDGGFALDGVPAGRYLVRADAKG